MTRNALTDFVETVDNTPQSQPIPGSTQVPNSAGGFAWEVDDFTKLRRFLILGTDGGSYYASQQSLTQENASAVARCLKADPVRTIQIIVEISEAGRAPNNDYALFALAMAVSPRYNDNAVARKVALDSLPRVARIGTHLFHFVDFAQSFRGWGRGLRDAVAAWYEDKPADKLAYQSIKYRQRDGWSHRDVLRKSHPQGVDASHKIIYDFIVHGDLDYQNPALADSGALPHLHGFEKAQTAKSAKELVSILRDYPDLPHEALPTELKNKPDVVMALLENDMPIGALIRNLATYTRAGALDPGSDGAKIVLDALSNEEKILKARIHPIKVLSALLVYGGSQKFGGRYNYYDRSYGRGQGVENPNSQIVDALDDAFYLSFGNVQPTGKTHLLALDVSSSMFGGEIARVPGLSPALGAAAMAMVTARSGDPYVIRGFATDFRDLGITAKQDLGTVMQKAFEGGFGGTDCSLPFKWASNNKQNIDVFVVYTDSETWAGTPHPAQALKNFRKKINPAARSAVVGMVANSFSIADPNDAGMLDVVGFDTATPQILSDFAQGAV